MPARGSRPSCVHACGGVVAALVNVARLHAIELRGTLTCAGSQSLLCVALLQGVGAQDWGPD